ncbi:MAG: hypothetical protein IPG32_15015 [Saprospirales bacterium]|nr:hypothetical protein [Saprospirales bacterium]
MNVKPLIFLLPLAALLVTCKKDDPKPEEKPILSLLQQSSIVIDTVAAPVEWVYGFTFKVKSDGIITKIGMKLPVTGTYTAKLWDMDENKVIREVTLIGASVHQEGIRGLRRCRRQRSYDLGRLHHRQRLLQDQQGRRYPLCFPDTDHRHYDPFLPRRQTIGHTIRDIPPDDQSAGAVSLRGRRVYRPVIANLSRMQ